MNGEDTGGRAARARAAELADELRGIVEDLVTRDLGADDLAEAVRLSRELRARLQGPARRRWYDDDAHSVSDESRRAYLDQSPIRGRLNPVAPPLVITPGERADGRPGLAGSARLGSAYEGPPHGVHGGWVAALFDDLLGATQGLAQRRGVTARLTIRYRHITPLDEELRLASWIELDRGRRLVARATCHAGDTLTADAEGLFVHVDFNQIQERMRGRRAQRAEQAPDAGD